MSARGPLAFEAERAGQASGCPTSLRPMPGEVRARAKAKILKGSAAEGACYPIIEGEEEAGVIWLRKYTVKVFNEWRAFDEGLPQSRIRCRINAKSAYVTHTAPTPWVSGVEVGTYPTT